jgi:hypothetical protein
MKRLLLLCLFCFVFFFSHGKVRPWSNGKIVLHSGDTIECKLRFTRKVKEGLLQILRDDAKEEIFTVMQVRYFEYYDQNKNSVRCFTTLFLQPEFSGKRHETFLEEVYHGAHFTIVNHRTLGYSKKKIAFNPFRKKEVIDNPYLVNNQTKEVVAMTHENLLLMLQGKQSEIESFIRSKGSLRTVQDYAAVLEYHAGLF